MMYPGMLYWWQTHRHGHGSERLRRLRPMGPRPPRLAARTATPLARVRGGAPSGQRGSAPARSACDGRCAFSPTSSNSTNNRSPSWRASSSELKTERAQAEVDGRRATASLADAVAGEHFDAQRAGDAGTMRVATARAHLRDAVSKSHCSASTRSSNPSSASASLT